MEWENSIKPSQVMKKLFWILQLIYTSILTGFISSYLEFWMVNWFTFPLLINKNILSKITIIGEEVGHLHLEPTNKVHIS